MWGEYQSPTSEPPLLPRTSHPIHHQHLYAGADYSHTTPTITAPPLPCQSHDTLLSSPFSTPTRPCTSTSSPNQCHLTTTSLLHTTPDHCHFICTLHPQHARASAAQTHSTARSELLAQEVQTCPAAHFISAQPPSLRLSSPPFIPCIDPRTTLHLPVPYSTSTSPLSTVKSCTYPCCPIDPSMTISTPDQHI